MKQAESLRGSNNESYRHRLNTVEAQHRELDARIRELDRRSYLTPSEQREVAELKKQKLRAKDEMFALRRGS
jgi:uncharacterized protein YdcH (DUF465 family)